MAGGMAFPMRRMASFGSAATGQGCQRRSFASTICPVATARPTTSTSAIAISGLDAAGIGTLAAFRTIIAAPADEAKASTSTKLRPQRIAMNP